MADPVFKKAKVSPRAPRVRYTLELLVESGMEDPLEREKSRIQRVKNALQITSRTPMGNVLMMERLLNSFEESEQNRMVSRIDGHSSLFTSVPSFGSISPMRDAATQTGVCEPYILASGENTTGCYDVHTASRPDEEYFIASTDALQELVIVMSKYNGRCPLCGYNLDVQSFSSLRHGHAARINFSCVAGHSLRWFSSSVISGKFTANLRYVSPTCFVFEITLLEKRNTLPANTFLLQDDTRIYVYWSYGNTIYFQL